MDKENNIFLLKIIIKVILKFIILDQHRKLAVFGMVGACTAVPLPGEEVKCLCVGLCLFRSKYTHPS